MKMPAVKNKIRQTVHADSTLSHLLPSRKIFRYLFSFIITRNICLPLGCTKMELIVRAMQLLLIFKFPAYFQSVSSVRSKPCCNLRNTGLPISPLSNQRLSAVQFLLQLPMCFRSMANK